MEETKQKHKRPPAEFLFIAQFAEVNLVSEADVQSFWKVPPGASGLKHSPWVKHTPVSGELSKSHPPCLGAGTAFTWFFVYLLAAGSKKHRLLADNLAKTGELSLLYPTFMK